jgi:hypothetical protein
LIESHLALPNSPKILTFRPFVRNAQLPFIGATLHVFCSAADRLSPLFEQLAPLALNRPHFVKRRANSFLRQSIKQRKVCCSTTLRQCNGGLNEGLLQTAITLVASNPMNPLNSFSLKAIFRAL